MAQSSALEQVSDQEMARFTDLIYRVTGIRIPAQKKALMSNRLRRRLRQTGIATFDEYYRHLNRLPPTDREWDHFLEEITTHESFLFRDQSQWQWFQDDYLAQLAAQQRDARGPRSLRVWSAACSTGDEPVTIACCIAAAFGNLSEWTVRIVGTDIGIGALEQARAAVYGERAMQLVPDAAKKRFFTRLPSGNQWQANSVLTGLIAYRQHNLLDPLKEPQFDVVFLKNVLIYFDDASKRRVMQNVLAAIRPGGTLVAGAAEGVSDYLRDLERLGPWLYRQPPRSNVAR